MANAGQPSPGHLGSLGELVDHRIPLAPAETPRAAARRLTTDLDLPEQASAGVRRLAHLEECARYAATPLPASDLDVALSHVRRAITAHASRRTRLRALLLPPSVLHRWQAGLLHGWDRAIAITTRWRPGPVRWRRLLPGQPAR